MITTPSSLLLFLAPFVPPQDLDPGAGRSLADEWRPLDGVALQVGDEILTLSQLDTFFRDRTEGLGVNISTQEEFEEAYGQALRAQVTLLLEVQAGQDLGLDPADVEARIRRFLSDQRRSKGATAFVEYLESEGIDPHQAVEGQTRQLYPAMWRSKITGDDNYGTRRVADPYIRPGELLAVYEASKSSLAEPDTVRLQLLDLPAEPPGGLEDCRALAEDLHLRILDGEEMTPLVEQFGASLQATGGLSEAVAVTDLEPALRAFAQEASPGEVSELLPLTVPGRGQVGFRIARIHSKELGPPPPPFTDPRVQRFLRREFENQRDERRLGRARRDLERQSHIWIHPMFGVQEPARGPGASTPAEGTVGPDSPGPDSPDTGSPGPASPGPPGIAGDDPVTSGPR